MKNLKKIISVTAAAAMVMSTVAPVSVFADDATFKIGGIGPVTGAAAIYGQAVKNATELAINEVNEDGGINGYQVEFKFEDDENRVEFYQKEIKRFKKKKEVLLSEIKKYMFYQMIGNRVWSIEEWNKEINSSYFIKGISKNIL